MEAFKLLFTTDVGLMSLRSHFIKLMNSKPGTEGWH
jgi:hypothetical protein